MHLLRIHSSPNGRQTAPRIWLEKAQLFGALTEQFRSLMDAFCDFEK
jgi:hypothetical protein